MNRERTRIDYADRIMRVVGYINDHLDEPLGLDRLAEVACFSRWHFHRIYLSAMGETADQTVRRLRLQRAGYALVETDRPLERIAPEAGYGSVEAFSRAFSASYGRSPTSYRAERSPPHGPGTSRDGMFMERHMTDKGFEIAVETAPERSLIGLDHRGSYLEIGEAFERLAVWAGPRNLFGPDTLMIGVYYDDPESVAEKDLRSFAGLSVAANAGELVGELAGELGSEMRSETLKAGPVARLRHKGPYPELPNAYRQLYGWLVENGREAAHAPPFEIYLNSPQQTPPPELLTDVCLPLAA